MSNVTKVLSVSLSLSKSLPPQLNITVKGEVPTMGWSNATLTPYVYIQVPPDGIQDFDLSATPPDGVSGDKVSEIDAIFTIKDPDNFWGPGKRLAGVRIHAEKNSKEAHYGDAKQTELSDRPVPWPWLTDAGSAKFTFPGLIGKQLRVYKTGDALTMDLVFNRVNIEVSPQTNLVVSVWIG